MVNVWINSIKYSVQTSWSEVDCDKLKECQNFKDEVKCLTDLPHEIIEKVDEIQLFPLYVAFSFIDDMDLVPSCEALNIAKGPYDDFEVAKQLAGIDCKPYRTWINVARVYYPEEKDSVRLIGLGCDIVKQISVFLSNYEDMLKDPADPEALQAGIEDLGVFGIFGTAYTLAGEDILKIDHILKLPTIRVYTALHYNWRKAKYMKRLWDIKNPKKPK